MHRHRRITSRLIQNARLCTRFTCMQSLLQFIVLLVLLHALLIQVGKAMRVVITCFLLFLHLVCLQLIDPCCPFCVGLFLLFVASYPFCPNSGLVFCLLCAQCCIVFHLLCMQCRLVFCLLCMQHHLFLHLLCAQRRLTLFRLNSSLFHPCHFFPFQLSCHCSEIGLILRIFLLHQFLCTFDICLMHEL